MCRYFCYAFVLTHGAGSILVFGCLEILVESTPFGCGYEWRWRGGVHALSNYWAGDRIAL